MYSYIANAHFLAVTSANQATKTTETFLYDGEETFHRMLKEFLAIRRAISLNETFVLFC